MADETFTRISLSEVSSTNDYALKLIRSGQPVPDTIINTVEQSAGRGLDKSQWESQPGMNLTISILIQPGKLNPSKQFLLNQITSLAVRDLLNSKIQHQKVSVKWPNDVYIDDKKAAGILINNIISDDRILWSVIGIGVNINQEKFLSDSLNPISLKMLTGKEYDLSVCLEELENSFSKWYHHLKSLQEKIIHNHYIHSLYRYGHYASYLYQGKNIIARITGLGDYGCLELEKNDGVKISCDLKELVFLQGD
ncbi:MAG: biotin--[acetyl-CoA-carboxylase] ligase [Bacteroidales bacterium]|nr:biotin--[acetyl-CoA-carboxylase] ligase [Bacteroidales bacterium]